VAKEISALVDRAIVIGSGLQNDVTEVDFFAGHQSLTTMTAYQREKSTLEYLEQGCVGIHERSGIHYFLKHAAFEDKSTCIHQGKTTTQLLFSSFIEVKHAARLAKT
jgi:hypothetical protein